MDTGDELVTPIQKSQYHLINDDRSETLPKTLKFIDRGAPLGNLAEKYLYAMLARERNRAGDLVMEAVAHGTSVRELYLHVLQPVQYEIGWLWQTGRGRRSN